MANPLEVLMQMFMGQQPAAGMGTPPAPVAPPQAPANVPGTSPTADFFAGLSNLYNPDPLGEVARSNSRPSGLTPTADWQSMFGGRPAQAANEERLLGGPGITGSTAPQQAQARATTEQQSGQRIAPVSRGTEVGPRTQVPFQQFTPQLQSGEAGPFPGVNLMQQTPYGPIGTPVPPANPMAAAPDPLAPWKQFLSMFS